MIRYLMLLILVTLITLITIYFDSNLIFHEENNNTILSLGFLLLFSYLAGKISKSLAAPMLTGYLIGGMLAGPYFLSIADDNLVKSVNFINMLALALIAFTAGGELKLSELKKRGLKLLTTSVIMVLVVAFSSFTVFYLIFLTFDIIPGDHNSILAASFLIASLSVAISPATAIAIIAETKSKGEISDTIIGVTIIVDILAIIVFAFSASIAKWLVGLSLSDSNIIFTILYELAGSLMVGAVLGFFMILFLKTAEENIAITLIGIAVVTVYIALWLHMSTLLVAVTAGFVIENFSKTGEKLIHALKLGSLSLMILFFSLAGVSFKIADLVMIWPLAIVYVLIRAAAIFFGSRRGIVITKQESKIAKYSWPGFIGQAGVTLGFLSILAGEFGKIAEILSTLVLGGIILNQIIGPVIMKKALFMAGEAEKDF